MNCNMQFILNSSRYSVGTHSQEFTGDGTWRSLYVSGHRFVDSLESTMLHEYFEARIECDLEAHDSKGDIYSYVSPTYEQDVGTIEIRAEILLLPGLFEEVVRITKAREKGEYSAILTLDLGFNYEEYKERENWFIDRVPNPTVNGFTTPPMNIDGLELHPMTVVESGIYPVATHVTRELSVEVNE